MRHSSNVQTETPSRCIPFHRQTKTSKRSKPIHHPQSEMPFILTSMQSVRVLIKAVLSSPSSSFRPFQSKDKKTKATPYPTLIVELAVYVVAGVHLPLATSEGNVHETAGVCDSLLRAALGGLLLLLWLNLWSLRLDLSGTSEGSVDLSHDCDLSVSWV